MVQHIHIAGNPAGSQSFLASPLLSPPLDRSGDFDSYDAAPQRLRFHTRHGVTSHPYATQTEVSE